MSKQVSVFYGTGEKMKLWSFSKTNDCPLYHESEDNLHITRCRSDAANGIWTSSIEGLE